MRLHSSVEESCEKTSLLDPAGLSRSYSEDDDKFHDADASQKMQTLPIGINGPDESVKLPITEFQTSMCPPSVMLSSYSTVNKVQNTSRSRSRSTHDSRCETSEEKVSNNGTASLPLTVTKMVPFLTGTTTFTLPYIVSRSGYMAMIILALISVFGHFTSFLVIDAMYEVSSKSKKRKRVHGDYADIARAAFGEKASKLVNFLLITYLFTSNITAIILTGKMLYVLIFAKLSLSMKAATAISALLIIPTLFVKKITHMAVLNILALISLIIGIIVTMVMFIQMNDAWGNNFEEITLFNWDSFAFSLSIWQYTLILHTVLPQVEGGMKEPANMSTALHISHITGTLIKVIYGLMGALAFGVNVDMLITDSLLRVKYAVGIVVHVSVTAYSVFVYPLYFYAVFDAVDSIAICHKQSICMKGGKCHFLWLFISRTFVVGFCAALAVALPHFGPLIGVLGALLGTAFVFVFPCLYHLKLKWNEISWLRKFFEMFVMVIGSASGVLGLYTSMKVLHSAVKNS